MTYPQAVEWLFNQLPFYQKQGKSAYKADLNNIFRLCSELGNPQDELSFIHVAGTNGKGSVCHMTASILQEAGYKVGLFTSPHLLDFRERIKLNGKMIPQEDVLLFVSKNREMIEGCQCSFFEATTAMMFWYFAKEKPDVVVLETGLGGRLDSTNIIKNPLLTVITNIGLDHVNILGDNIVQIAKEKAGIIKAKSPLVLGVMEDQAEREIIKNARLKGVEVCDAKYFKPVFSDLKGSYQLQNSQTVQAVIKVLENRDWEKLSKEKIERGLANVVKNTGLHGRWELVSENPKTILDAGHNKDGIKNILACLKNESFEQLHWVFASMSDKDLTGILSLLPSEACFYITEANTPRSRKTEELTKLFLKNGFNAVSYNNIADALSSSQKNAKKNDLILIAGSIFLLADYYQIKGLP